MVQTEEKPAVEKERKELKRYNYPDVFIIEVATFKQLDNLHRYQSTIGFCVPTATQPTRYEVICRFTGKKTQKIQIDCVKPLDPYPQGMGKDVIRVLRLWIIHAIKIKYPDWSVTDFSMDKIDLTTPVYERPALKE